MIPHYSKIHNKFRLNNNRYTFEDLKEVAYSHVKEGLSYEQVIGDFLIDWLNDKDSIEVKTSGSTGTPKVITLQKQAMVNSAIATGDFFNLKPGDRALHCLPTHFIAGKMMFVRALILGLEIDIIEPTSQPIFDYEVPYDLCAMVPLQLSKTKTYINNIKTLIVGGAPVLYTLKEAIKDLPTRIYETYGMTETITHVAVKSINNVSSLRGSMTQQSVESYFQVLPNINISQDDRDCLIINAPNLSKEKIVTNDVVKLHSKNEFEWLGRYDHVINSGGVKLFPEQIEAKLQKYIEQRFFIASEVDETLGEKVIVVIEGEPFHIDTSIFKLLEKYETPKTIYFSNSFFETTSRKIQRKKTLQALKG